uniref:Bifunctional NAD(P)H-hydrate repair enzyme n=1 Tax=Trypanosoma congolense (strain IL3000) TaxID=1068625 RepID=G0UQ28_TRYCI|nr:conserved hypothetical protein [Trypanosoma congolense IL3000]
MSHITKSFLRHVGTTADCTEKQQSLLSSVWSAAWLRRAEVEAARAQGVALYALMQRAAAAAFSVFRREYPHTRHWLILCGSGNNGGDGFEIARLASEQVRVTVVAVEASKSLPIEATTAHAALLERIQQGAEVVMKDSRAWMEDTVLGDVDLVVDGLLGIGMGGPPRDHYAELIERVNKLPQPRVSIDIPSGLNAETGDVKGACVRADHTVTFIAIKPGLLTGLARNYVGKLHYDPLQLADWMLAPEQEQSIFCRRLESSHLVPLLSRSVPSSCIHKGANGKVLLVGGDSGFGGAIAMSAEAALRTGSGLVRVLTRAEHIAPLLCRCPEVMTETLTETSLRLALEWATCVAVGPGLGQAEWGKRALCLVDQHLRKSGIPSVWDADALNILAACNGWRDQGTCGVEDSTLVVSDKRLANRIITPHSGEAARLLGCTVAEVEQDRYHAAEELAAMYGGVVLLKGPGTVLYASEDMRATRLPPAAELLLSSARAVADVGNSGMATGGMGDVLTGIIAGFLAQRLSPWHAACVGCLVHGTAADLAATAQGGERGLTATALFDHLPACINPTPELFKHASL